MQGRRFEVRWCDGVGKRRDVAVGSEVAGAIQAAPSMANTLPQTNLHWYCVGRYFYNATETVQVMGLATYHLLVFVIGKAEVK